MNIEDEKPEGVPVPETQKGETGQVDATIDSAEVRQESAREIMLNFLAGRNVIAPNEISLAAPEKVDELMVRTAHDYEHVPEEISQPQIDKARRILGLRPNIGEGKIDTTQREGQIDRLIEEMRGYLEQLKKQHSEVVGLILCGSRMDIDTLPASNSDVDVVLVLREGTITDPRTQEGESLLYKLRSFSDATPTDSGLPVELDELYSTDELFAKLQDTADRSKLTWGWDPNAVKYIGDDIDGLDELGVNIEILRGLNSADMEKLRTDTVAKAKELIVRYLGRAVP